MNQFKTAVFFSLLSFIFFVNASEGVVIGEEIFDVYKVHTKTFKGKRPPIPALFVYDATTERYLSSSEAILAINSDKEMDEDVVKSLKTLLKEVSNSSISKDAVINSVKGVKLGSKYTVFYHNLEAKMLDYLGADYPLIKKTQIEVIDKLNSNENFALYTMF